jgi:hypothetical protein
MSAKNFNALANMLGKIHIASPKKTVRKATAKNNRYYSKNATAKRTTQRKGPKTHSRFSAATARRRKAAATAKAAKNAARIAKRKEEAAALVIEGRTRGQQKAIPKNEEMK